MRRNWVYLFIIICIEFRFFCFTNILLCRIIISRHFQYVVTISFYSWRSLMDHTYTKPTKVRVNPSRAKCEMIISRILSTELKENGKNIHFKNAMDFMTYFESLYPAGSALTKQVQRAIKSMDLAKDENGFFLLEKTTGIIFNASTLSLVQP